MIILFFFYVILILGLVTDMNQKPKQKFKLKWIFLFVFSVAILTIGFFLFQKQFIPFVEEEEEFKKKVQIVDENSKERPFAIMINNISVARPYHSGLQDAYLVYEMIVEGGITRYLAFFQEQVTSQIGPIRSARPYYLDYVMENDAYFVHWGFSEEAKSDIKKYSIQNINGLYQDQYFWKDRSLPVATEHTAFSSIDKLSHGINELKYRLKRKQDFLFSYSADPISFLDQENVQIANEVSIPYSKGTITNYVYHAEEGKYYQFVNGIPHIDFVTKEQYKVKNIIVYQVKNNTIDQYGRQSLNNIGEFLGYYITNGEAIPIRIQKKSRESQTIYSDMNGKKIELNDGNTWIHIEPENQELKIIE